MARLHSAAPRLPRPRGLAPLALATLLAPWLVAASPQPTNVTTLTGELRPAVDLSAKALADYEACREAFAKAVEMEFKDLPPDVQALADGFSEVHPTLYTIDGEGCSWRSCGGGLQSVTASSSLASQGKNSYAPGNAYDDSLETAWVEGVEGDGVDQWLEYTFEPGAPRITHFRVWTGYTKSESAFKNNGRPKQLVVSVGGLDRWVLPLQDNRGEQRFEVEPLGNPKGGEPLVLRFRIDAVYPGAKWKDTAIGELAFDGIDVH